MPCTYCDTAGHGIDHHGEQPWQDEVVLRELYTNQDLSSVEISDKLGCSKKTVLKWMDRPGIERGTAGRGDPDDPWRDRNRLEQLYCNEELTSYEISELLGCSQTTIVNWLEKHGIKTRPMEMRENNTSCRDEALLRKLYHAEGMSIREIATHLDVDRNVVRYWMLEHGIERRDTIEAMRSDTASFGTDLKGYERWRVTGFGHDSTVRTHRLLAISEGADPHEIFSGEVHVHHKNTTKWDNRPENIDVLSAAEHARLHHSRTSPSGGSP